MKCRKNLNPVTAAGTIPSLSAPFKCNINKRTQECKILDTNNCQNKGTTNNNNSSTSQDVSSSNSSSHLHRVVSSLSSIQLPQGKYSNCCSTSTSTVYTINSSTITTADSGGGYSRSDGIDINRNHETDSTEGKETDFHIFIHS